MKPLRLLLPLVAVCSTCLVGLRAQEITISGTQFLVEGRPIWLNGINAAWIDWNDFGGGRFREFLTVPGDRATRGWDEEIASYAAAGINCARIWIDCDGTHVLRYDSAGNVTGTVDGFIEDVGRLLDIGQRHGVYIMPVLTSFDHAREKNWENTWQNWRDLLANDAKIDTYINNVVIPLVEAYPDHPYLFAWEICNEPEWMYTGSAEQRGTTRERVVAFHARVAAAINQHTSKPVTTGTAGWQWMSDLNGFNGRLYSDASLQAAYDSPDARLDFYQVHYYGWMQSQGASPFDEDHTPSYFLDAELDRPVIIGECPGLAAPTGGALLSVTDAYQAGWANGYAGVMAWSSSGHDGAGTLPEIAVATERMRRKFTDLVAVNRPVIYGQPAAAIVAPGKTVTLEVDARAATPLTYQWSHDGVAIDGTTSATLTLSAVTAATAGNYTVSVSTGNSFTATSQPAEVRVVAPEPGKLKNLSILAHSGAGADVLTAGFVTTGGNAAQLVVRGVAQKLAADFNVGGTMTDPQIALVDPSANTLGGNTDWDAADAALMAELGAFGLDADSGDAVFAGALPVGVPISALVTGEDGGTGIVLVEVYDATAAVTGNRLVNLSARLRVEPNRPATAGFVIDGNVPHQVLIRGAGDSLRALGLTTALTDPSIVVNRTGENPAEIARNLDWGDEGARASMSARGSQIGAFPFNQGSLDAGLLLTLHPGSYTVTLSSANDEGGIALVEVYDLGEP
ncbi:immunoglobulin domain-containing protein [Actomonas aquatica]|uniref:Cellulase family glycosylhydrolase n=1 Tax=Actomonas aquatica TaxID=2866162 RepID=A0ABZ1C9G5_9BACT|nr:immunoglobulin domain-containing protein [Opitutus sp. WL0086]WRQ88333.1 cellulase family glycosylhydrolase [Opitutus sp. WL0086]